MMVVSMLAKVSARELAASEGAGGGGGGLMAEAPHSCHEKGRTGSLILGAGGGTFVYRRRERALGRKGRDVSLEDEVSLSAVV